MEEQSPLTPGRCRPTSGSPPGTPVLPGLVICLVLLALLGHAVLTTMDMERHSTFLLDRTHAFAMSEGISEVLEKHVLERTSNFDAFPASGDLDLGPGVHHFTIRRLGSASPSTSACGTRQSVQRYELRVTARVGSIDATTTRVVDLTLTPIFQYLIFSQGDLEVFPASEMTLEGRIHANGSLYLGSSSTLTIDTCHLTAARDLFRRRKDNGLPAGGRVAIRVNGEGRFEDLLPGLDSAGTGWTSNALALWKGTVATGAHGVVEAAGPGIRSLQVVDPDTGDRGFYHRNAGLVICNREALDAGGKRVRLPHGAVQEKTFYDARERRQVIVTEIDLSLLGQAQLFPRNGLLYAYRSHSSPFHPDGIRLTGGAELARPLTVATPDPLYIRGDFNTINKKGAAVMADAVNLLSGAWDDTKQPGSLPRATATRYNVAILSGDVPTPEGGCYSGGFENFPRLHEDWTGVEAVILGSFVKAFESRIARSLWRIGGDAYAPPVRRWAFDPDLLDPARLPPFTPNSVALNKVLWDDGLASPLFRP